MQVYRQTDRQTDIHTGRENRIKEISKRITFVLKGGEGLMFTQSHITNNIFYTSLTLNRMRLSLYVPSSRRTTGGSLRRHLAMATLCFSPPLSFNPLSPTFVSHYYDADNNNSNSNNNNDDDNNNNNKDNINHDDINRIKKIQIN